MEKYHHAWLSAHPERTEQWLAERLADGFHIHHMNGNHDDDEPRNLVLIESGDHMMIHNGSARLIWTPPKKNGGGRPKKIVPTIAEMRAKLETAEAVEAKRKARERKLLLKEKSRKRLEETRLARQIGDASNGI